MTQKEVNKLMSMKDQFYYDRIMHMQREIDKRDELIARLKDELEKQIESNFELLLKIDEDF